MTAPLTHGTRRSAKIFSWLTLLLFVFQNFSGAAPLAALPAQSPGAPSVNRLELNDAWGRITERFAPPGLQHTNPGVIYIQDAHAQPDAQEKIRLILEYLAENNLADAVYVEGAEGTLRPDILDLFPDRKLNLEIAHDLFRRGELTGAEMYAFTKRAQGLPVTGIEDQDLYRASYQRFRKVKGWKKEITAVLKKDRRLLEELEMKTFPPELRDYMIRKQAWQAEGTELGDYLKVLRSLARKRLRLDLSDPRLQFDWPALVRFTALERLEASGVPEKAAGEAAALAAALSTAPGSQGALAGALRRLAAGGSIFPDGYQYDESLPGVASYRGFFEFLSRGAKAAGIDLLAYPDLMKAAGIVILREEVDGTELSREIGRLEILLEAKLVRTPNEAALIRLSRDFILIEKLFALALTREEYREFLDRKASLEGGAFSFRLRRAAAEAGENPPAVEALPAECWREAGEFYMLSEKRDGAILDNMFAKIRDGGNSGRMKVLIAGGFHSDGIGEILRRRGIPHAIVTPRINRLEDRKLYEKVMLGTAGNAPALGNGLVKMLILEAPENYARLRPDATGAGQADLILRALEEAVVPALRQRGLTNREIYEAIAAEVRGTPLFQGTRAGIDYDAGNDRIVFGEWNAEGRLAAPAEESSRRIDRPAGNRPHFELPAGAGRSAELAAAGPLAAASAALSLRSEVRPDILKTGEIRALLAIGPSQSADLARVKAAIREIEGDKERILRRRDPQGSNPLLDRYADSLKGPSRPITVIEALTRAVAFENRRIESLPLPYRAAFALAVFDAENFPRLHARLVDILNQISMEEHFYDEYLTAAEYRRVTEAFSRAEHQDTIAENLLLRFALNWLVFDIPRVERRALEKENIVTELMKELSRPGSGNIRPQAFLTDLHGSTKVGSFIAYLLRIDDYQNITSPEELEERLLADWKKKNPGKPELPLDQIIEERKAFITGGSDYVDRGPKPYWGFRFNKWLRSHGLLDFISGNHDQWKDENVLGLHLLVQDTFRAIQASRMLEEEDVENHFPKINRWVSRVKIRPEDTEANARLDAELKGILSRFLALSRAGAVTDETIEEYADKIIDAGDNANHALVWWAREWGIHGGWFDTFLDQINEELVNGYISRVNQHLQQPGRDRYIAQITEFLAAAVKDAEHYSGEEREAYEGMLKNLREKGTLLDYAAAENFLEQPDVDSLKARVTYIVGPLDPAFEEGLAKMKPKKQADALIKIIKDRNIEIRAEIERLVARGELDRIPKQYAVPSAFEYSSAGALRRAGAVKKLAEDFNRRFPGIGLPVEDVRIVNHGNYRSNPSVTETVLWDLKNFRLIYTDPLGNFYSHGIIPIDPESRDLKVQYETKDGQVLSGVAAIERIQLDIREFFEKHPQIEDTPDFRELVYTELGQAFEILNSWYSDTLAYLKPLGIAKFVETGGPSEYPLGDTSAWAPREFTGNKGVMHVGHVEAGKLRSQKPPIPYWVGAMDGGLLHGDYEMSEGYAALGAMIVWFGRDMDGKLQGVRRLGYRETVASLTKKIDELKKKAAALTEQLRKAEAGRPEGEPPIDTAKVRGDLEVIEAEIQTMTWRRDTLKAHGEEISDITFADDINAEESAKIRDFTDGVFLADYYIVRFLQENIETYAQLKQETLSHGRRGRVGFYERREKEMRRMLEEYLKSRETRRGDARSEIRPGSAAPSPLMTPEEVAAGRLLTSHLSDRRLLPDGAASDSVLAVLGNPYGEYPALAAAAAQRVSPKAILVVGKGNGEEPEFRRISRELAAAAPGLAGRILVNPADSSMHTGMNVEEVVKLFKQHNLTARYLLVMQTATGALLSRRIFEKQWAENAAKHGLDVPAPIIVSYPADEPYFLPDTGVIDEKTAFYLEHALGQIDRLKVWPDGNPAPILRHAEDLPAAVLTAAEKVKTYLERRKKAAAFAAVLARLEEQLAILENDDRAPLHGADADRILERVRRGEVVLKGEDTDIIHVNGSGTEEVIGPIDRGVAEEYGLLHRTANAFIRTPEGKYLMQRRAAHKKEPLRYSLFGGHLAAGQSYFEAIQAEIRQELGLPEDWQLEGTFELIGPEGGFASPAADAANVERRSLYIYNATERELAAVRTLNRELSEKLAELGVEGYGRWLESAGKERPGAGEVWSYHEWTLDELKRTRAEELSSDLLAPLLKSSSNVTLFQVLDASGKDDPEAPGLMLDRRRSYVPSANPSIDEIAHYYGIPIENIKSVTIVNHGSIRIPVYAAESGVRWGTTVDLFHSRLEIETVRAPVRSEVRGDSNRPQTPLELVERMGITSGGSNTVPGDYESGRWVAVHITHGIYALLPPGLSGGQRAAAADFLKRDLFYFDYAGAAFFAGVPASAGTDGAGFSKPAAVSANPAALDISVIRGVEKPDEHFLGIASALKNQPGGYIHEYVLDGDPAEIGRLQRAFTDEYGYAGLSGRYRLEAVPRKEVLARVRRAVREAFNQAGPASGVRGLAEFREHVTFSSFDENLLREAVTDAGWLLFNDLDPHPGVQTFLNQRAVQLGAGLLDAELLRRLEKIRSEKMIVPAGQALSDVNLAGLITLWDAYRARRLTAHSA